MAEQLLLLAPGPFSVGVQPGDSTVLYNPGDAAEAYATWRASCGPCALAAVLGVPVRRVRRCFPDFPRQDWVNPSTMWSALKLAGRQATKLGAQWPRYGLAFVQWGGPWLAHGQPVSLAYRHTHWVGMARRPAGSWMVYDVNTLDWGGWLSRPSWTATTARAIMATIPEADGTWFVRWACDIHPVTQEP